MAERTKVPNFSRTVFIGQGLEPCFCQKFNIYHHSDIFALGVYEFLAMLEGKIREAPFFKVQSGKITV